MNALRFWCTPGEAWIRLMARLHGARAVVVAQGERRVEFSVALSGDHRWMRIKLNDEFVTFNRAQAVQLVEDMGRTVSEMVVEAGPV